MNNTWKAEQKEFKRITKEFDRKKKQAPKSAKGKVQLWVGVFGWFPEIRYPDGTIEYFAVNDPNPRWVKYKETLDEKKRDQLSKIFNEFICVLD